MRRHTEIRPTPEQERLRLEEIEEAVLQAVPTPRAFPEDQIGEYRMLPTHSLALHPKVQKYRHGDRPATARKIIDKIIRGFDARAFGRIGVVPAPSDVDADHYIIFGGHRWEGAKGCGFMTVPCEIHAITSEAALVKAVNNEATRMSHSPWDLFCQRFEVGDKEAVAIEKILRQRGLTAVGGRDTSGKPWRTVTIFTFIYYMRAERGIHEVIFERGEILDAALKMMCEAWDGLHDESSRKDSVLRAIAGFHWWYRQYARRIYDPNVLTEVLAKTTPEQLWIKGRQKGSRDDQQGDDATKRIIRRLVGSYNHRGAHLPAYNGPQIRAARFMK